MKTLPGTHAREGAGAGPPKLPQGRQRATKARTGTSEGPNGRIPSRPVPRTRPKCFRFHNCPLCGRVITKAAKHCKQCAPRIRYAGTIYVDRQRAREYTDGWRCYHPNRWATVQKARTMADLLVVARYKALAGPAGDGPGIPGTPETPQKAA